MSDQSAPHILIFDSGVGGLSIMDAVTERYPHCRITYSSDNALFPYGTKTESLLIERVDKVLHQLQALTQADMIIVACNTASTVALPKIRERFSLPIIGVVPAIKPAAQISQTKTIGLLATPGTVSRQYTQDLINEFATHCDVISLGSSELVLLAEDKLKGNDIDIEAITAAVTSLNKHTSLDTLVLACTHFPLLKTELQAVLPNITFWVDSGDAIARRVGYWLEQLALPQQGPVCIQHHAYFTADTPDIQQLQPALKSRHLQTSQVVEIT